MKVRGVDLNNDWLFGKGLNDYKTNRNALAQNIKTRLQSFLGDCFFDLSGGIDWFNLLGSKQVLELRLNVASVLLNTQGVQEILEVSSIINQDRNITLTYTVNTVYGTLQDSINQGAV